MAVAVVLGVSVAFGASLAAQRSGNDRSLRTGSADLVQIDVVVTDSKGQPVEGLTPADFRLKEDGRQVELKTFAEANGASDEVHRSVVLLLDDFGVPASGTNIIKGIATGIVDRLSPRDEVSVVRLGSRTDEAFGDRLLAMERIRGYVAGRQGFVDAVAEGELFRRVDTIASEVASLGDDRKVVICIGAPIICNAPEPGLSSGPVWSRWAQALSSASRTNLSVYAIVPARARFRVGGLPEFTGGRMFATTSELAPAVDQILREASHYYLLGYWPSGSGGGPLHRIDVSVEKKGVRVLARKRRGE